MNNTKYISTVLIANRGEIASRIIRTCKKMGIRTVAVFSDADRDSAFVSEADIAIHIGGSTPKESYLDAVKIIDAAKKNGADAIHPGYGFLSENADFAEACAENGIIFIGPNPNAIRMMGSKSRAKSIMKAAGVPVVPGYQGEDQSVEKLSEEALKTGLPVLLKAAAGGGGKGMRIVHDKAELNTQIEAARREAAAAFGNDELIVEKYIQSGRHIEFQIFGDQHGNYLHLLERECTIQRRYQKIMEESPSPVMSESLRRRMGEVAVSAARALEYDNAGTVEFIYDESSGEFYFLEVNTRLQVEHPVTEMITGLDLVQWQIEAASGRPMNKKQEDITGNGYAVELRLYAEDATNDFMPVTGKILHLEFPQVEGLRVESAVKSGSQISVFYDPMIAKLIVWDRDRYTALRKMQYVLKNMICLGTKINQDFLLHLLQQEDVMNGAYDTHFIEKKIDLKKLQSSQGSELHPAFMAATLHAWSVRERKRTLLRSMPSGWRNSFYQHQFDHYCFHENELKVQYRYLDGGFEFIVDNETYLVNLMEANDVHVRMELGGMRMHFTVVSSGSKYFVHNERIGSITLKLQDRLPEKKKEKVKGNYEAPIPSQIVKILVSPGQMITSGDTLMILVSMKMENAITADADGTLEEIYVSEGDNVEAGTVLMKIREE
jgi:acetyl-CoA carboxylase biotin carboxylase subunit